MNVSRSDQDVATDGGKRAAEADSGERAAPADLFSRTADVSEVTFRDRLTEFFDAYVYTPLSIGWSDWRTRTGGIIILFFVGVWIIAELTLIAEPTSLEHDMMLQPFHEGWVTIGSVSVLGLSIPFPEFTAPLGTDVSGRSIFEQLVHGTPPVFKMILSGAVFSAVLGTLIGTVAGYKGGRIDGVLMTFTDIMITIPGLALVIVIAAVYPPRNPFVVGLILGIDNWPGLARTLRSQVLSIREESFVEAHRTMGLPTSHIVRRDIISQLMPYISINFANGARRIIFESVALYFLGILPFAELNWGIMMNLAYKQIDLTNVSELYWVIEPMILVTSLSLGLILFAQGLDQVFNVRLQARHAKKSGGEGEEGLSEE